LGLMAAAARAGREPFHEAVKVQQRLFTTRPIFLGVEESLKHPVTPCGLKTDAERARRVRHRIREFLNSRGEWERHAPAVEKPLRDISVVDRIADGPLRLRSILTEPAALEKIGQGNLVVVSENDGLKLYGRSSTVADLLKDDRVVIAKWVRRLTEWNGRQAPLDVWKNRIAPLVEKRLEQQKSRVVRFVEHPHKITAELSLEEHVIKVPVDQYGVALWRPPEREVLPEDCARCELVETCRQLPVQTGVALLWRRMGLVDAGGVPTRRGEIVSFFSQGDGLAVAAALEDESYVIEELLYDLANLDAGFRFCGDDNRWGGRLARACQALFGLQSIPGYLENGVPPKYGAGAETVVAQVHRNPGTKTAWVSDLVGAGDIDRIIIEWRSLLRQIVHAPDVDWERWRHLKSAARVALNETDSPTLTDLPPLEYSQTRRVDHRLVLRRH
jgi:hypothetical protein